MIGRNKNQFMFTGSNNDGTKHDMPLGSSGQVRVGKLGGEESGQSPLSESTNNRAGARPLYGLSPLIRLINRIEITSVAISSSPGDAAKGYIEGERITIRVNFSEAVSVSGSVFVPLSVGGRVERAVYASGSGTREQIWTAELGVGSQTTGGDTIAYGYGGAISGGSLSDKTFELGGSTYTIELVGLTALTGAMNVMQLKVASALPTTTTSAVKLHICGDTFEFSSATYNTTSFTYQWSATGLDWSMVATRRMTARAMPRLPWTMRPRTAPRSRARTTPQRAGR